MNDDPYLFHRSGVIQAGDSLLAIQGDSPLGNTIDKLTARYLSPSSEFLSTSRHLSLVTQYTVAENVIPSSGVFDVRIIKRSASLGINLQGTYNFILSLGGLRRSSYVTFDQFNIRSLTVSTILK